MRRSAGTRSLVGLAISIVLVGLLAVGCARYYKVTDVSTGKEYYTQQVASKHSGAVEFVGRLKEAGVLMLPNAAQKVRAVTHLDVSTEQIDQALLRIEKVAAN